MIRARVLLLIVALAGVAAGLPTYYYMPAYEGGACTIRTIMYRSVVTDMMVEGKKVLLAKEPGVCRVYVIVGE